MLQEMQIHNVMYTYACVLKFIRYQSFKITLKQYISYKIENKMYLIHGKSNAVLKEKNTLKIISNLK